VWASTERHRRISDHFPPPVASLKRRSTMTNGNAAMCVPASTSRSRQRSRLRKMNGGRADRRGWLRDRTELDALLVQLMRESDEGAPVHRGEAAEMSVNLPDSLVLNSSMHSSLRIEGAALSVSFFARTLLEPHIRAWMS